MDLLKGIEEFNKSQKELVTKSIYSDFDEDKFVIELLEKAGKNAVIGEVRTWGGKKYKKQSNGKWMQVSESHGMTKKEHEARVPFHHAKTLGKVNNQKMADEQDKHFEEEEKHKTAASKLSDKEYDESELSGEKKHEYSKGDEVVVGKYKMTVLGYTEDGKMKVRNKQGENFTLSTKQTEEVGRKETDKANRESNRS